MKKKVEEYEYDEALEPSFRKSLFKTFNKTLEEGFFPMIIVDAINHKVGVAVGMAFLEYCSCVLCTDVSL